MTHASLLTGKLGWLDRSSDGSRMNGDVHVRFCERPGVRFPRPTHQPAAPHCPTIPGEEADGKGVRSRAFWLGSDAALATAVPCRHARLRPQRADGAQGGILPGGEPGAQGGAPRRNRFVASPGSGRWRAFARGGRHARFTVAQAPRSPARRRARSCGGVRGQGTACRASVRSPPQRSLRPRVVGCDSSLSRESPEACSRLHQS